MKAVFVSDIHVGAPDDPRARALLDWLDRQLSQPPTHLFLVGDIFDLWIADRAYFVARYAAVIARLRRLVAAGCEVHYFEGNHDLDLDVFWRRELGVHTHDGPALFTLGARRVWVEHGDQMDPDDRGYHFLRWLLRTPVVRALGRHLPPRIVRFIGERASRASRRYTTEIKTTDDERARRVIRAHAARVRAKHEVDVIVSGHVHVVDDTTVAGARVFNLGTWLKQPMVLEITDATLELRPLPT